LEGIEAFQKVAVEIEDYKSYVERSNRYPELRPIRHGHNLDWPVGAGLEEIDE
jgi:hypothetical protein